jgi:hypothetical protein
LNIYFSFLQRIKGPLETMGCKNPMMTMNLNAGSRINGRPHNMIGINFPKGLVLVIGGVSFSKDGIAEWLYVWSLGNNL